METRVSLKYFVSCCPWKLFFDSNCPQTTSKLISLILFVTVRPSTRKKVLNFPLFGNYFSDLFTEVETWY